MEKIRDAGWLASKHEEELSNSVSQGKDTEYTTREFTTTKAPGQGGLVVGIEMIIVSRQFQK